MLLNFAQQNIVLLKVCKKKKKNDTDCYCHVFLCLGGGNMGFLMVLFLFFKDNLELLPLPKSICSSHI